jgi:hypothetical protein
VTETNLVVVLSGATRVTYSAASGADRLLLDFSGGNPIPMDGLTYTADKAGTGNDVLDVVGAAVEVATLAPVEANPVTGTLTIDGRVVTYTGVREMNLRSLDRLTYVTPGAPTR